MREYTTPYRESVVKGIRDLTDSLRDSDRLLVARNLRPYESGLRLQQVPTPVVHGIYEVKWPFPQLLVSSVGHWICGHNQISLFDPNLVINSLVAVDEANPWSIADFGKFAVGMNGYQKIAKSTSSPYYVGLYTNNAVPTGGCCCDFNRGQLIVGDLSNGWYDGDENYIAWSRIGEVSCIPDRRNTAGWMPMDWGGRVLVVKQLGQHIMVYGEGGISWIHPDSGTWGQRHLEITGVPFHTAVAGDKRRHYVVDNSGELWRISSPTDIVRLGGKGVIQELMGQGVIVVTHHPRRDECYVSGESFHYVRTRTGWGGPNYVPLSGTIYHKPQGQTRGGLLVVPARGGQVQLDVAEFLTDTIVMGSNAQKTLQWLEVQLDTDANQYEARARYRYYSSDAWKDTGWKTSNSEGVTRLDIAGTEFQLGFRVLKDNLLSCLIDEIRVKWKATDNRFARGTAVATAQQGGLA